ncbi:GntR family transcriptional regulator [[Erwinia] mediterraneensis]|uniref:GntR family transcriptional regulator n=1 Tax=[Erwinia] mediterraneensis TaxID=2161819 RepID=UPI00102FADE6|nr:GntR family transcriptional regulator [[Erwinia] mediterraneensis]
MNEPLGLPLYLRIKNIILERIIAFSYQDKLPGELVLADEFNVARGTVKQAIDALVQNGILFREQGKGTFINRAILQQYYRDLPELLLHFAAALPLISDIASLMPTMADAEVAEKMDLAVGSQLLRLERSWRRETRTIGHGITWLDGNIYNGLSHLEANRSLYAQLRESHGISPLNARDRYLPVTATARLARLLAVDEGSALFCIERLATHIDDNVLEFSRFYVAGGELALEINASQLAQDGRWHATLTP